MKCTDLAELNELIQNCTRCNLAATRKRAVVGEGNVRSRVLFLAQAPGKIENDTGKMFVGPSGKRFYELLSGAGIETESFYMTNLIKCYLPKSRRPSKDQIETCSQFLECEISMLKPELIIPLGFHATRYVFKKFNLPRPESKKYNTLYGQLIPVNEFSILPLRHPTALLFNPQKQQIMQMNYAKAGRVIMGITKK